MLAFVKKEAPFGSEILEWPEPSIQSPNEVLIEGEACGICGSDVYFYEWAKEMYERQYYYQIPPGSRARGGRGPERSDNI